MPQQTNTAFELKTCVTSKYAPNRKCSEGRRLNDVLGNRYIRPVNTLKPSSFKVVNGQKMQRRLNTHNTGSLGSP